MNTWIYVLGERGGEDVKIGLTNKPRAIDRLRQVNSSQTTNAKYVFLVAVLGTRKDETFMMIQQDQALSGPLAGTAWDWLVSEEPQVQDYFTPPELVCAARAAMGGIDLDAASHWLASPTWAFTTIQAAPFISITSGHLLLSPTPEFWGNSEGRTGRNDPHSIVYIGDRVDEFQDAFTPHGIVMSLPTQVAVA